MSVMGMAQLLQCDITASVCDMAGMGHHHPCAMNRGHMNTASHADLQRPAASSRVPARLTALQDVVLATGIHDWLVVAEAAEAHPAGHTHHIPGGASAGLALGDGVQATIAVGPSILQRQ